MIYLFYGKDRYLRKGVTPVGKKKLKLFIDIDNTIYNSTKRVVDILNERYCKAIDYRNVKHYSFLDQFPEVPYQEIKDLFDLPTFYTNTNFYEFLTLTAFMVLTRLCDKNKASINFVTLGTIKNLEYKRDWLNNACTAWEIEYNEYYGNTNSKNDKTFIDMSDGILIDDNAECLRKSNASIKILLKNNKDTSWNKVFPNDEFYIANDWNDVYDMLTFFYNSEGLI